jgi:hypothetical protein
MSLSSQIEAELGRIENYYLDPHRGFSPSQQLDVANLTQHVRSALQDDAAVAWPFLARDCANMGDADNSALEAVGYWYACEDWQRALTNALEALRNRVGLLDGGGEVLDALLDQVDDMEEGSDEVIGDPSDWWAATPGPLKLAALLVGVLIVRDLAR